MPLVALLMVAYLTPQASAQTTSADTVGLNIPWLHHYGTGTYELDDRRVFMLAIRAQPTILPFTDRPFGISLRLAGGLGWHGTEIPDAQSTIRFFTFVPGVSFDILAAERLLLRPYVDFGFGRIATANEWLGIGGVGILSEWLFPWRRFELALEPEVQYTLTASKERLPDNELFMAALRVDLRHPLWFTWMGAQTDLGGYVEVAGAWGATDIDPSISQTVELRRHLELGVSFGQNPRPKIWLFRVPRFTVAFRFASDFRGLRLSFGDRKLRLPPR